MEIITRRRRKSAGIGGGFLLSRSSSGLLTVGGTATNAHDVTDWTDGVETTTTLVAGRIRNTVDGLPGTVYHPNEWTISPDRTKRWLQYLMLRAGSASNWLGFGPVDRVGQDAFCGSWKNDDVTNSLGVALVNNAVLSIPSGGLNGNKVWDNEYRQSLKVEDGGASDLKCTLYDFQANLTDGPQTSSILGATAKLGTFATDTFTGDLGDAWDMSDWIVTVNGLENSQIARVLDGGGGTIASAVESGGSASIDLHAANAIIEDCVSLVIRNSGDTKDVSEIFTPTDDGTFGEAGIFGGDVITA